MRMDFCFFFVAQIQIMNTAESFWTDNTFIYQDQNMLIQKKKKNVHLANLSDVRTKNIKLYKDTD